MNENQVCSRCYHKFQQVLLTIANKTKINKNVQINMIQSRVSNIPIVETSQQSFGFHIQANVILEKFIEDLLNKLQKNKIQEIITQLDSIMYSSKSSDISHKPILEKIEQYINNKPSVEHKQPQEKPYKSSIQNIFNTLKENELSEQYGIDNVEKEMEEKYFSAKERSTSQGQYSKKLENLLKFRRDQGSSVEADQNSGVEQNSKRNRVSNEFQQNSFLGFPLKPKLPSKKKLCYYNKAQNKKGTVKKKQNQNKSMIQQFFQ